MAATASAERFPAWPTPKSQHDRSRTPVRRSRLIDNEAKELNPSADMWRALASVAISRVLLHCCQVGRHRLLCGHRDHGMLVSSHIDPAEHRTPDIAGRFVDRQHPKTYGASPTTRSSPHIFRPTCVNRRRRTRTFRAPVVWWAAVIAPSEPTGQSSVARVTTALPTTSDRAGRSWSRRLARR